MWTGNEQELAVTRESRFTALELGPSPVLGPGVRLDLTPDVTVLVGRNGAGKSALLERIFAGLHYSAGDPIAPTDLARLVCEAQVHKHLMRYECTWTARTPSAPSPDRPAIPIVEERCTSLTPSPETLWQVTDGKLAHASGASIEIPAGMTVLQWMSTRAGMLVPSAAVPLLNLFTSVARVMPAALRDERRELIVPEGSASMMRWLQSPEAAARRELGLLLYQLGVWHTEHPELLAELAALGQRTGLCREIRVKTYRDPDRSTRAPNDLLSAEVDGVDLGLLSDGTVRALQILRALIEPEFKLVLIDEPESAVHPGLLAKLLHEITAYSKDRQIVLSTHSPQVVSWARPDAIRLVTRTNGVTRVQSLGDDMIKKLAKYLHDEDTLGQFVYGGGLDGLEE
jgi:predicted ATPase